MCLGILVPTRCPQTTLSLGPLAQARLRSRRDATLIKFLLLDEETVSSMAQKPSALSAGPQIPLPGSRFQVLYKMILGFLIAQINTLFRQGFLGVSISGTTLNSEMSSIITSLGIISYALLAYPESGEYRRSEELRAEVTQLSQSLRERILNQDESLLIVRGFLDTYRSFLCSIASMHCGQDPLADGAIGMAEGFDADFWQKLHSAASRDPASPHDEMELDDEFEGHGNRSKGKTSVIEISHDEVMAATNLRASDNSISAKVCYMSTLGRASGVPPSFIDYLTSFEANDFLSSRPFLRELCGLETPIEPKSARKLLEYLGQELLEPYDLERCEVSLGVCLDIMTGLATLWTISEDAETLEYGSSLYEWFIKIALNRGILSSHVHICISSMLQRVIKVRPEYARSLSLPSARTSLFRVLKEGSTTVKFHVANHISEIFGLFILKEHNNILEDVIGSLPSDIDWSEGIALRLYVLSHLASSWSTLLRRCVYAIFETPANVPNSIGYARHCLDHVSKTLRLKDSKELLRLFASQIIYTWLETQTLRTIPYSIFGYGSLSEFLRDVKSDVVGQIVMRGKVDEVTQLATDLASPYGELLESSFSKAAAYSIARDITIPPSQDTLAIGAEKSLRKYFGKEQYSSLLAKNFPGILATFYKTMGQEESIERAFQKHPAYAKSYSAYRAIVSTTPVDKALPENQQPSFRTAYLIDEIEYLNHRTTYDTESMWTHSLYIYIFRELLSTIHPALGSLHACSVLRRIRILICMSGITSLECYPIEMALHALRPFLTDTQCADDAIGIVQYLLTNGALYLKEVPSFLAGLAVSTLTSMKAFLVSIQESTTQESQFKATMSKARAFHLWLGKSLEQYASPHLSHKSVISFKALIKAAEHIQTKGNPRKGTYESDLLLEILEDQCTGRNLLNQPSQDLILSLLCADFELSSSFRDDILGSDEKAARYAPTIWRTYQRGTYGKDYSHWVGRVLGRAYAGTGSIHREMTLETGTDAVQRTISTSSAGPRSHLLRLLCDVLLVDNRDDIVLAEETLRSIVTGVQETECFEECEEVLSAPLMQGMLWKQYNCPPGRSIIIEVASVEESATFDISKTASQWAQQLCVSLALTASDDPIVSHLPPVLFAIEDFAAKAFPYILHLVLMKEVNGDQTVRKAVSESCQQWFEKCDKDKTAYVKILLKTILYLRKQPLPHETTKADRSKWLEIDYAQAAEAAAKCSMFRTSLLFLEIGHSEIVKASRRLSAVKIDEPSELLLRIFENIDEQDAFYGVQRPSSLSSIMARLEYENAGLKSLSFRGAHYDSQIRQSVGTYPPDDEGMVRVLDSLDLNGLSQSMLSRMSHTGLATVDSMLRTARKLEEWDISIPTSHTSSASIIYRAFQSINKSSDYMMIRSALDVGFSDSMRQLMSGGTADTSVFTTLTTLGVLSELDDALSSNMGEQLEEVWARFDLRNGWMRSGR